MEARIQANIKDQTNKQFKDADSILFTGSGGTPSMDINLKNVPPIKANYIPEELQIKEVDDSFYYKSGAYKHQDLFDSNVIKYPIFRVALIQDKSDFIYNPKISFTEKYFSRSYTNSVAGTQIISVIYDANFYNNLAVNDRLLIKGKEYIVNNINLNSSNIIQITLDRALDDDVYTGDYIINLDRNVPFTDAESLIGTNYTSPIKLKFVDINNLNVENQTINLSDGTNISEPLNSSLSNTDTSKFIDLYDVIKEAVVSSYNLPIQSTTYSITTDIFSTDTVFKMNDVNGLNIGDYITLIDAATNNHEIVKIISINSTTNEITVKRGLLNTSPLDIANADIQLYLANYVYFHLIYLPVIQDKFVRPNASIILKYA